MNYHGIQHYSIVIRNIASTIVENELISDS